ncbi:MAG: hypothetical protein AAGA59_21125 [Actinomycetota bacterium]
MTATDSPLDATVGGEGDDPEGGALRRIHFHINDQITCVIERMGLSVLDRRLLDALAYAEGRGLDEGLPVATICDLVPPSPKPQTALSALSRMAADDRAWVARHGESAEGRRGKRWRLTDVGHRVRHDYLRVAETVLREVFAEADAEEHEALVARGEALSRTMDEQLGPVVDFLEPTAPGRSSPPRAWSAVCTAHFFVNDLIFERAEKVGVDVVDRRILDALSFAASRGVPAITVGTLAALITPTMRPGLATNTLDRMLRLGWIDRRLGRRAVDSLWSLTARGRDVRHDYTRFAEARVATPRTDAPGHEALRRMAAAAESHRLVRLEAVLRQRGA